MNGGVNHFGSPFNFPEEFVTVYRLHPLVPDLIEYRDLDKDPNQIRNKIPVIETFEGKATDAMHSRGLANWALSMGRQRLGAADAAQPSAVPAEPQDAAAGQRRRRQIDIAALDLIRDRERGVPRFNEFRRQYGLRQLTSFDDFVDKRLPADSPRARQQKDRGERCARSTASTRCDAQGDHRRAASIEDSSPINDCLGHPNGTDGRQHRGRRHRGRLAGRVDAPARLRDLGDAVRGVHPECLAPPVQRPVLHLQFRPEFYTPWAVDWVNEQRPRPEQMEKGTPNGHGQPVSPLKRVLLRRLPGAGRRVLHGR